jgi:hypothetical protein
MGWWHEAGVRPAETAMVSRFGSAVPATSPVGIRSLPNWLAAGPTTGLAAIDSQHRCSGRLREEGRAQPPFRGNAPATCGALRRLARVTFSTFKWPNFRVGKLRFIGARGLGPRTRHKCRFVPRSPTGSARGECATDTWLRDGEATMAGFDTPSDGTACTSGRQCPVCRGPMQVVGVESGVPGLRPDLRRQMIKCSACELVAVHTFALEQER